MTFTLLTSHIAPPGRGEFSFLHKLDRVQATIRIKQTYKQTLTVRNDSPFLCSQELGVVEVGVVKVDM